MKINRSALIFGGIILVAIVLITVGVWFASLFSTQSGGGGAGSNLFSSLFPFGQGGTNPGRGTGNGTEDSGPRGPAPTLREISRAPVSGAHFQTNGAVRFMERETGHVFETFPADLETIRISNTTIPEVQNTVWLGDSVFVLQYLDQNDRIRNYLTSLASSTPDQTLTGKFLSNFTDILQGSDEKNITGVVRSGSGIAVIATDTDEKVKKTLFASLLRSWIIHPTKKGLLVGTPPSIGIGYLYRVNEDRSLETVIGGTRGLMVLPNASGELIAYSRIAAGATTLFILDTRTGFVSESPIATFAEKCAWTEGANPVLFCGVPASLSGASIENWLMGVATFSDSAWIINPKTGSAQIVRSLEKDAGRPIDIVNPAVSSDGAHALFINKNDLSLWSLSLTQ